MADDTTNDENGRGAEFDGADQRWQRKAAVESESAPLFSQQGNIMQYKSACGVIQ